MDMFLAAFSGDPLVAAFLAIVSFAVGLLYGFVGFGPALIFIPVAALSVPVETAILWMAMFGLTSSVVVLPRALRECDRGALLWQLLPALIALPFGTALLHVVPKAPLTLVISLVVLITLAALLSGWRLKAPPKPPALATVGMGAGLLGGATGLTGPLIILVQLAGTDTPARIRANTMAFLTILGAALLPSLALNGLFRMEAALSGLLLAPLYMVGTRTGAVLFTPERARLFRVIAYSVIALAGVAGLPIWR